MSKWDGEGENCTIMLRKVVLLSLKCVIVFW